MAVIGTLARIFGACLLFAVWGGATAMVWSGIGSYFWRIVAIAPMIAVFVAGLASLMVAVTAVENRVLARRKPANPKSDDPAKN